MGGTSTRWVPLKLAGKRFAFDETGVVCKMFAPYEVGVNTSMAAVEYMDMSVYMYM